MRNHSSRVAACCLLGIVALGATKVDFAPDGTCRVDGRPFFPIGIWVYSLDPAVMADLHEHRFNTIVGVGFAPRDLPLIEKHGLMCIPQASDEFIKVAKDSPSLLAWYLVDEPEEHGLTPEQVKQKYDELKKRDSDHPIGITHDMLSGPPKYKGACDFTMTDVYPVTRDRDWPLSAVGQYTDGPRQVHGPGWPNFTFVQTFGGPDTDSGKWAQPLPHEVRFMVFDALIHRANGILYFSYWPRAPITWAAVAKINTEVDRIVPWLLAPGEERPASASDKAIEIRARKINAGWLIIVANTSAKSVQATLRVDELPNADVRSAYEPLTFPVKAGQWPDRFAACEAKVYLVGDEPR